MIFFLIVLLCIDDCDQILVSVPINYSKSHNFVNCVLQLLAQLRWALRERLHLLCRGSQGMVSAAQNREVYCRHSDDITDGICRPECITTECYACFKGVTALCGKNSVVAKQLSKKTEDSLHNMLTFILCHLCTYTTLG